MFTEKEKENLTQHLSLEYGAAKRYEWQIEQCQNPRLNAVLAGVMRNERDHFTQAAALLQKEAPAEKVRGFASILFHLRQNLAFETEAARLYGQFAQEAVDPALKKMFFALSRSEAGHVQVFRTLIKEIEEGRYPVVFYCPICGWELDFGTSPAEGQEVRCGKCGGKFALKLADDDWQIAAR